MTVATLARTSAENRKAVIAGTMGNVLEWYDFGVYGYLATTMSQLFFPGEDKTISLLKAFASSMRPSSRRHVLGVTASLVIAALSPAIAQEQSHAAKGRETSLISTVRTGKERLGRKWMDEQRIDNCKVPINKRGNKPRLDTC
jgi:hypothetical protein